jgi:run domain Beclin-1 interacting cysteine-rich containing protein
MPHSLTSGKLLLRKYFVAKFFCCAENEMGPLFQDLRMQLVAVKKYLKTCRQAQSLTATFDGYIPWTADVHTYSIDDFLQIKLKLRYLRSLLQDSIKHVKSCPLCQGKGFVCEFCNQSEIIFPFELKKVTKCTHCLCCFHKECFNGQPCPRCIRMRQRERRRRTQHNEDDQQTNEH